MHKSNPNSGFTNGSKILTFIHTGIHNNSSPPSGFVHVNPCPVKTSEIIDYRYYEFKRIIRLKEQALKAFHGIGRRMSLGKRIAGEGLNLSPYFAGKLLRISHPLAVFKKLLHD